MMDSCVRNTFAVLTHRCELEDILEMYEGKDAMFFGNPVDIRDEEIKDMIKYFEETEEYEYCKELKELLEAKGFAELDMFLEELRIKNGQTPFV
jgi:hypothetical protein